METITNDMDTIDSRDIIERIEELESGLVMGCGGDVEELKSLKSVFDQAENCGDFKYGEGLIRESHFVEYCEQLCEDIGDIPANLPWYIKSNIDWDGVADEIKQDYTEIDFDGVIYFIRD